MIVIFRELHISRNFVFDILGTKNHPYPLIFEGSTHPVMVFALTVEQDAKISESLKARDKTNQAYHRWIDKCKVGEYETDTPCDSTSIVRISPQKVSGDNEEYEEYSSGGGQYVLVPKNKCHAENFEYYK